MMDEEKTEKIENKKHDKFKFCKRIWYSITKIEKYPEMVATRFWKSN